MKISKKFYFDAAHKLPNHNGKCRRLHGHSYMMEVTVDSPQPLREAVDPSELPTVFGEDPQEGMLMDFGYLKGIVQETIVDKWDHRFLAQGDEGEFLEYLDSAEIARVGVRTTAENLARVAATQIFSRLGVIYSEPLLRVTVRLWETPHSWAESSVTGGY